MSQIQSRGAMPQAIRERWETALKALDPAQIEGDFAACEAAAREPSFSGFVRRSVHRAGLPLTQIEEQTGIPARRLADFLRGRGSLDNLELDRLLDTLGIELLGTPPR